MPVVRLLLSPCAIAALLVLWSSSPATGAPKELTLTVVDADSGAPIAGAAVKVSAYERDKPAPKDRKLPSREYIADDNGMIAVSLADLKLEIIRVRLAHPGHAARSLTWIGQSDGRHLPSAHTVKLEPGVTVGGVVRNRQGKPIKGATVKIQSYWRSNPTRPLHEYSDPTAETTTDDNGRWEVKDQPKSPGNFHVKVTHPDYLAVEMNDKAGDVVLGPGVPL